MKVTVREILIPEPYLRGPVFEVQLVLEVDGNQQSHIMTVDTVVLADVGTNLVQSSRELDDLFRFDQRSLHQIMQLVGRAVRHGHVHLPQLVAA